VSGRKNFEELRKQVRSDPVRRVKVEAYKRAMRTGLHLAELRKSRAMTQESVAAALHIRQPNLSRIEGEQDPHLSTLSQYVAALGGQLHVTAVFPDEEKVELLD
jgi:DNA-binding XRE family transcriptional regulator